MFTNKSHSLAACVFLFKAQGIDSDEEDEIGIDSEIASDSEANFTATVDLLRSQQEVGDSTFKNNYLTKSSDDDD